MIATVLNTCIRRYIMKISLSAWSIGYGTLACTQVHADFRSLPELKWKFTTSSYLYAAPVADGDQLYLGGCDSLLHAISLADGKEVWTFRTGGEIRSEVAVYKDMIILNGGDGNVYALDKQNGTLRWTMKTGGEAKYDFADYFHSTPVIDNDQVLIGSGDHRFYCLSAATGKVVWSFTTGGIVHNTAVVDEGKVFFGAFDGYVYALDRNNGTLIWKFKTVGHQYFPKGEVQGSPVAEDGLIFIGARDYNMYALDQDKGYCHWNLAFKNGWGFCTSLYDGSLFIGSSDERVLLRVDPSTGKEEWRKKMEFLVFGKNAYSRSMLYIGTTLGKLHGIDLETGETRWSYATETYQQHRLKYFREDDSYRDDIYTIIRSNEQFLDVECELGGIFARPVIAGNYLLFASTNGNLYCLQSLN